MRCGPLELCPPSRTRCTSRRGRPCSLPARFMDWNDTCLRPWLPPRGRSRLRSPLPDPKDQPARDPARGRRASPRPAQAADRGLPGRRAETIAWHLEHHHNIKLSRATIHRLLSRAGTVEPQPKKRPKSSYIRFAGEQPNECWQSDFTHYRLTRPDGRPGQDTEIITWLDDHSRFVVHASAHRAITSKIVLDTFRKAAELHGYPASTLTDNGLVYTARLASPSRRGGRTALEKELRRLGIVQKNGKPNSPTTQGKVDHLHRPPQDRTRYRPQHRHPRPRARRPRLQSRLHHPVPLRNPLPHRHRTNPRRNLRPGPRHPHHQRRHRRDPARTDPRPHRHLPAHRPPTRPHPKMTKRPNLHPCRFGRPRCPETSQS